MLDLIITLAVHCDRCGHVENSSLRDSRRAHDQRSEQGWTFDTGRPQD